MCPLSPFLGFLQRHVPSVAIDFVLLVFDNYTQPEANGISATLNALPTDVIISNVDSEHSEPLDLMRFKRILVISLIVNHFARVLAALDMTGPSNGHRFVFVFNASAPDEVTLHQKLMRRENAIYAMLEEDGSRVTFVVWQFMDLYVADKLTADLVWLPDELRFVNSIHWQVFRAQLDRIPSAVGDKITSVTTIYCPMMACRLLYRNTKKLIAGVWPGLNRLVAHAAGASRQKDWFQFVDGMIDFNWKEFNVNFMDRRQFVDRPNNPQTGTNYRWSIRVYDRRFYANAMQERYVVLAPRRFIVASEHAELLHRATAVGLFVAIAMGFTMVRFVTRVVVIQTLIHDFTRLFFDTLPRSLGIAPGRWSGSAADRLLLFVIAVTALLLGSLFSGLLYGQMILDGRQERYNTLLDLCEDRVPIHIPFPLFHNNVLSDISPLCVTLSRDIGHSMKPNEAYVFEENVETAMTQVYHHKLPLPYGSFPVRLVVTHWFLRRPIQMALARCSEHGLYQALRAAANHSVTLFLGSEYQTAAKAINTSRSSTSVWNHFEFMLLAIGLMTAIVSFVCELLAAHYPIGRIQRADWNIFGRV